MKRKGIILGLGLLLIFVTGFETPNNSKKDTTKKEGTKTEEKKVEEPKVTTKTITSTDGHFTLDVNDTWEQLKQGDLNKSATLEIGSSDNSKIVKYGMILSEMI